MTKIIFLLYHDIDSIEFPSEKKGLATTETVVRLSEFESHMAWLDENGWNVISIQQFLEKQKNGNIEALDIVLTFDDGHISNHRLALPVLQKYGFRATFFIIADRIGIPYHMGIEELRELDDAGMEIGSHGLTHTYLPQISEQEIERELLGSKKKIEKTIGKSVDSFAYPGGHYNDNVLKCIGESSYKMGASCIVGCNHPKSNRYLLRRIEIRRGTSVSDFKRSVNLSNILFYQVIGAIKNGLKKIVGLEKYTALRQKLYFLDPFKR